jgi:hypothetical protein
VCCLLNNYPFAEGNFGDFQGASEVPVWGATLIELATQKIAKIPTARRVAVKMARRLRCCSVTYRHGYAPSQRLGGGSF